MNLLTEPEQFQRWKDSPQTKDFLRYLKDQAAEWALDWAKGTAASEGRQMQWFQAQAAMLHRLLELDVNEVREFYELPPIEGESE